MWICVKSERWELILDFQGFRGPEAGRAPGPVVLVAVALLAG